MSKLILYIILFCSGFVAYGQRTLSGIVTDEFEKPLPNTAVRVLTTDSAFVTGTTTDKNGEYKIGLKKNGSYILQYNLIGYYPEQFTTSVDKESHIIPTVRLKLQTTKLKEIIVSANNITRVDNHLLIVPDKMSVKHSFSAYQLLENIMLPGFEVIPQSGSVTLFKQNVALYIDGEKADYNLVKNLRSKDIEKIEYHDVPTGRYSNDYAAINFITRKYTFGGYANLEAQEAIGFFNGTYEAYTQIAKGNTKYHFSGGYTGWNMARDVEHSKEIYQFPDNPVERSDNNLGARTRRNMEYGQVKIGNSTQKRQLSAQASVTYNKSNKYRNGLLEYTKPYDINEESHNSSNNRYIAPSLRASGFFFLPKNSFLLANIGANYNHSNNRNLYIAGNRNIPNSTKEDYVNGNMFLSFWKNMKHNNTIGLDLSQTYVNSSIDYAGSYNNMQRMWRSDTWLSATYRHQIKKVSLRLQPGFAFAYTKFREKKMNIEKSATFYAEINYRPTKIQQLSGSFSLGSGFTPMSNMTDAEIMVDFLNATKGNPNLKKQQYYYTYNLKYSIMLGKFNLAANANYKLVDNSILPEYYIANNHLIKTYISGKNHTTRAYVSANWNATKNFKMNLLAGYVQSTYKTSLRRNYDIWYGSMTASYFIKDFSLNLRLISPDKIMNGWATTKIPTSYTFTVNWNHKNWSASAWMANPFNRVKNHTITNIPVYYSDFEVEKTRCAFVKLIYTFDFGKKIQRTGVERVNTSAGSEVLE